MSYKKLLLSCLSFISLCCSVSAPAVQVYNKDGDKLYLDGRFIARRFVSDNTAIDGDRFKFRLNILGESQINTRLAAFGRFEHDFSGYQAESETSANYTRYAYAGLRDRQWGELFYGRVDGVLSYAMYSIDIFPVYGAAIYNIDNFLAKRAGGVLTWKNRDLFDQIEGLTLTLQYQGKNEERKASAQNGDGYGVALEYAIADTDVAVTGAWISSDRTDDQQQLTYGAGKKASGWISGIKWQPAQWHLSASWGQTENLHYFTNNLTSASGFANRAEYLDLAIRHPLPYGLVAAVGYQQAKGKDIEAVGDAWLNKFALLYLAKRFNKNFSVSAEYRVNMLQQDNPLGLATDDSVAFSMVYNF